MIDEIAQDVFADQRISGGESAYVHPARSTVLLN